MHTLSPDPQGASQSAQADKKRSRAGIKRCLHLSLHVLMAVSQAYASIYIGKRRIKLLAKPVDTDSVQTRQEACAVPRNYPVEPLGVGHSEGTPVETALPVDTPVSAKCVTEAGNPTLSERDSASRVG